MGCTCGCLRQEGPGFSFSSWRCSSHRCCCCGMCAVIHPFSGKRDTTSSLHSASVPQTTGLLDITSGGVLSSETVCTGIQQAEQISLSSPCANIASIEGGPESIAVIGDAGGAGRQNKEQDCQKEKGTFHVSKKKSKGFGSIESILLLPEDEENCPICLEEYDKENPRIDTVCEHHYHLGCILEWMERSENCPMCDKEIVFYESL
eukprot:c7622_g1_i1 orf=212-826(+)